MGGSFSMQCFRGLTRIHTTSSALRTFASTASSSSQVSSCVLENGVTVIVGGKTDDTLGSAGVFVNTGSAYENHSSHGCSHYLRRLLYKSTNRVSGLRLTRTIESITASFTAENNPEYVSYKALFPRDQTENILAVMADILRPRLAEWEFRDVRNLVRHDVNERSASKESASLDKLRHVAYGGSGLGRSALCPSYNVNEIYPDHMAEYILGRVYGSNITVVGNANNADQFAEAVANAFGALPKNPEVAPPAREESKYVGGSHFDVDGPRSYYAEGYKGAAQNTKAAYAQQILAELLGYYNPNVVSPNDRLSSRLATSLQGTNVSEASSFILDDSETVFGIRASGNGPCRDLAEAIHNQLNSLSNISEEEFNNVRNIVSVRSRLFGENRSAVLESLYRSNSEGEKNISSVTVADVRAAAKNILASKPTIYASGDLSQMPSFTF